MTTAIPTTFEQRSNRIASLLLLTLAFGAFYYLAAGLLYRSGYISHGLLFFAEKVLLALHGEPPRLVNIGFVYPPLTFLLMLPFVDPLATQAFVSGTVVALVISALDRYHINDLVRWSAKLYVAFSPLVLFLALESYGELLFCAVLGASIAYFNRFLRRNYSLHLFAAATLLALTFFIDFRSVVVLLAVVPAMALPFARSSQAKALSIALTVTVPIAFVASMWMYVNWIFLGDPLAFLAGGASYFRTFATLPQVLAVRGDPRASLLFSAREIARTLPVTLPYFIGLVALREGGPSESYPYARATIYLAPVMLLVLSAFGGIYRPTFAFFGLFVFVFILNLERMRFAPALAAGLVLGIVGAFFAPLDSPSAEERAFAGALAGRPVVSQIAEYETIARRVSDATPAERILLDDAYLFPLVYLVGTPDRFLLPYQYEYPTALSQPRAFARYVVVARMPDDTLHALYPATERGDLPGFREILRTERFITFERVGALN